jgi:hypothetical protein
MSFDPDQYLAENRAPRSFDPDAWLEANSPPAVLRQPQDLWSGVTVKRPKVKQDPDGELPVNRALGAELRAEEATNETDEPGPQLTTNAKETTSAGQKWPTPPAAAIKMLRENPETAAGFEETFGPTATRKFSRTRK